MDTEYSRPTKKRQLPVEERQRAVRACGECRRLKEKCEGGVPCKRCRHLRRPCEFSNRPAAVDKRAPDLADSIKDLRDRLQYTEYILKHYFPNLALDTESLRRTCASLSPSTPRPDRVESAESLELPANAHQSDSPGIEDEDCTLDYVDGTTAHYSGEFSHWNFSMHIKRSIDELMASSNASSLNNVSRVPDFIRVGEADPGSTSILDIIAILPPRPVTSFLINVFFKHATSFYYYVDRRWLDGFLDKAYANIAGLRSKDITAACVVLMVLAVGTQYVHLESPNQNSRRSSDLAGEADTHSNWHLEIGSSFYRQVARLLSEVIHAGSLLSAQVFLLLGLYSLPIDASGLGYIYLNLSIKVAIQNGLHRKVVRTDFDANTKEIRRRIWWTAYCMERKIGIYHGRPASIVRSDIDADVPWNSDAAQADDDPFDSTGLLESINLMSQAEAFLHEMSCLRTCSRSQVGMILNRIKRMKSNMRGPWSPPHGDAQPSSTCNQAEQPMSRAEIHSKLECCLLHMFIGRPFILAHRQMRGHSAHSIDADAGLNSSTVPQRLAHDSNMQWDFLVRDCIAAAEEVISICHNMRIGPTSLAKSSYAEYSSCRASLLVLIAYSICYRTNEFSGTLQRGLDTIREMASVGESARSEVSLLETLEAALHRLHVFNPTPTHSSAAVNEASAQEGYEGFRNWYTRLAGASNSPASSSSICINDAQAARAQHSEPNIHSGPSKSYPTVGNKPNDPFVDDYPFDFDILSSGGNMAFFTPDINDHTNPERTMFENLFWMPT